MGTDARLPRPLATIHTTGGVTVELTPGTDAGVTIGLEATIADNSAAMAGTSGTPSNTNRYVTDEDGRYGGFNYGDGSDGDVTISSGTTSLTRGKQYGTLRIDGTGHLHGAGFAVLCDTLDLRDAPARAIRASAGDGTPSGATAVEDLVDFGVYGMIGGSQIASNVISPGAAVSGDAAGNAGDDSPDVSTAGGSPLRFVGGQGGGGGAGGRVDFSTSHNAGGAGGAGSVASDYDAGPVPLVGNSLIEWRFDDYTTVGNIGGASTLLAKTPYPGNVGGAGGSGGAIDNSLAGGYPGSGGGHLIVRARRILTSANTPANVISARGGAGETPAAASTTCGGSGAGGGGGGGFVAVFCDERIGPAVVGGIDASGGPGGTGGATSSQYGAGGNGGDGGWGGRVMYVNRKAGIAIDSGLGPQGDSGAVGQTARVGGAAGGAGGAGGIVAVDL